MFFWHLEKLCRVPKKLGICRVLEALGKDSVCVSDSAPGHYLNIKVAPLVELEQGLKFDHVVDVICMINLFRDKTTERIYTRSTAHLVTLMHR